MHITTYLIYLSMKTDCAHLFRSHYLQTKQRPSQNKAKHRVTMATNIDNGKPQRVKLHLRIRALHRCRRCWPACQACLQSAGCFLLIYSERNIITYALSIEWSNMYLKRQRERESNLYATSLDTPNTRWHSPANPIACHFSIEDQWDSTSDGGRGLAGEVGWKGGGDSHEYLILNGAWA